MMSFQNFVDSRIYLSGLCFWLSESAFEETSKFFKHKSATKFEKARMGWNKTFRHFLRVFSSLEYQGGQYEKQLLNTSTKHHKEG